MLWQKLLGGTAGAAGIKYVGGYVQGISGETANQTISLTSLTGGVASAPSAGDMVIVYFGTGSTAGRNLVVSGYTELGEVYADDTYDTNLVVAYKFMGSTPDTNFVLTGGTGSSTDAGAVYVSVWRGVDTTVTQRAFFATGTNSVLPNPPPITPDAADAYIVAGGAGAHIAGGSATFSSSDLTAFRTVGQNDTNDVTIGGGYHEWTSGAFDPAQFTFSTSNSSGYSNASCTISLVPEQNGITPPVYVRSSSKTTLASILTINKPTGTTEGDLMVAFMVAGNDVTWTGDSGWTDVAYQGVKPSLRVAFKIAGASEGSSYTFNSSVSTDISGVIVTFRNAVYETSSSIKDITPVSTPAVISGYNALIGFVADVNQGETTRVPGLIMSGISITQTSNSELRWVARVEIVPAGQYNREFSRAVQKNDTSAILVVLKPS